MIEADKFVFDCVHRSEGVSGINKIPAVIIGHWPSFAVVRSPLELLFERVKGSINSRSEPDVLLQNVHVREEHSGRGPQTFIHITLR